VTECMLGCQEELPSMMFISEITEFQLRSIRWVERYLFILNVGAWRDVFVTLPRMAEKNHNIPVRIFSRLTETVIGYCLRTVLLHQLSWCIGR
jgi:hypothetical protein